MTAATTTDPWINSLLAQLPDDGSPRTAMLREALTTPISSADAEAIRRLIARYFAQRLSTDLEEALSARGVTPEMLDRVATGELSLGDLP